MSYKVLDYFKMTSEHQEGARPEGRIHRSLASAEARQDRAEAEARYGKPPPQWPSMVDTVANVGGVAVGAATFAAAMQGYDRYMALISARNARGRRVNKINRNPSSRSGRRDL